MCCICGKKGSYPKLASLDDAVFLDHIGWDTICEKCFLEVKHNHGGLDWVQAYSHTSSNLTQLASLIGGRILLEEDSSILDMVGFGPPFKKGESELTWRNYMFKSSGIPTEDFRRIGILTYQFFKDLEHIKQSFIQLCLRVGTEVILKTFDLELGLSKAKKTGRVPFLLLSKLSGCSASYCSAFVKEQRGHLTPINAEAWAREIREQKFLSAYGGRG